jgi:hypothetical protein
LEMWMKERPALLFENGKIEKTDMIIFKNVAELENELDGMITDYQRIQTPAGLTPFDTYKIDQQNINLRIQTQIFINHYQKILENIKNRVYDFLGQTEKQLLYGQYHADIFERNRQYVELRLGKICHEALKEFDAALTRVQENTPATRAQALLSCRRLLKDLADVLYPPTNVQITGADGKQRDLSEDKYINRLWQFIYEKTPKSTSGQLLMATIDDLGHRIDRIYDAINKGIHAEIDEFEVNQCLIQTYLVIGDLLRVFDRQSATGLENSGESSARVL